MKIKPIKNIGEYTKYVTPNERIFFFDSFDSSPVSEISTFPNLIFTAIHGGWTASGSTGTVYVGRDDTNDTVAANIDPYRFNITNDGKGTLEGIIKDNEYHHIDDIPDSWEAPKWLINRIEILRKSRRLSSTSGTLEGFPEESSN